MPASGAYFYICPDIELIREQIQKCMQSIGEYESKFFWGDDDKALPDIFWQELQIAGLFSKPKALIVRRAQLLKTEHWNALSGAMRTQASSVTLFLCLEGEWKKKTPPVPALLAKKDIYQNAEKHGLVWQQQGLTQHTMSRFVQNWATRENIQFAQGALQAIAQALPHDAYAARLELDKLSLAADKGLLQEEHARLIAPHAEMDFFQFTDALSKGEHMQSIWQRVFADHRKPGKEQMLFPLLASVAREARMMMLIVCGEEKKIKAHPYVKKLKTPIARRLGKAKISRIFDLLFEAEFGVKTGQQSSEQALELLVSKLSMLYRAS